MPSTVCPSKNALPVSLAPSLDPCFCRLGNSVQAASLASGKQLQCCSQYLPAALDEQGSEISLVFRGPFERRHGGGTNMTGQVSRETENQAVRASVLFSIHLFVFLFFFFKPNSLSACFYI